MTVERIVVGVDGSPGADAALEWACDEAELHGAALDVVMAMAEVGPWRPGEPVDAITAKDPLYQEPRLEAERVLGRALSRMRAAGLDVETTVVEDAPARALTRQAAGADLLVVGKRGRGGFVGLLLGSVSQHCVQHAPCPVVVVPPRERG
jgi:nucleotide-binding universal stress UspA family protein